MTANVSVSAILREAASLGRYVVSVLRQGFFHPQFCFPVLLWLVLFTLGLQLITALLRPPISVQTIPLLERRLAFPHRWFRTQSPNILIDLGAALPYTFHFCLPLVFIGCCWWVEATPRRVLRYATCLGTMNVIAVLIQILCPVAPPWYFEKYGFEPASYDMKGDPAGLSRVDNFFGTHYYRDLYAAAPIVFGAFPSLHAGWPYLLAIFEVRKGRRIRYFAFHTIWVWWAALYLEHHFLVDIIGGATLAHLIYWALGRVDDDPSTLSQKDRPGDLDRKLRDEIDEESLV